MNYILPLWLGLCNKVWFYVQVPVKSDFKRIIHNISTVNTYKAYLPTRKITMQFEKLYYKKQKSRLITHNKEKKENISEVL